ncbi:transcriptional protein SWT1 [Sitophilus oryzae]|uniref:Transcriptional protein SWT1 n=1 Tax=Sitophilus oryzae TaxID=7048 RepID=A0A6J2YQ63_SITOR|nr:transcriptional protein SWT1 [Sitophilus oryzae]XP_030766189.1 transcriptional protein SWT1 [Sitophilus oryzae]
MEINAKKDLDVTVNDSLLVNFDDTIVNKREQTCNTIAEDSMEWDSATEESPEKTKKENAICIVTDTNVFMHFLHKIKDIVNFKVTGSQNVKVFIPWMVITELDYIKDTSREGKNAALNAAKYINRLLEEKNPKVLGQPVEEAVKQEDYGLSPDDKILSSCVQASKKYESVILLTNDVNLRNKALLSELETSSPREILQKLLFKLKKNVKSLKISQKMASLCSTIICERCKETYGNVWDKMDMLQGAPWNFRECLRRIIRYWKSVFRDLMLKQCLPTVEALYRLLDRNKDHISDDSDTFNEFMKLVLAMLVFLKDMEYKTLVQSTINEVTEIADN